MEKKQAKMDWHALNEEELFQTLATSPAGLNSKEAGKRLREYGYNELAEKKAANAPTNVFRTV